MNGLTINRTETGDASCALFALSGPAAGDSVGTLQTTLVEAIEAGAVNIILDMQDVDYISSSGVRALVAAHDTAKANGGSIAVKNPSANARYVLEITGLDDLLPVED